MWTVWPTLVVVVACVERNAVAASSKKSSGNILGDLLEENAGLLTNLLGESGFFGSLLDDKVGFLGGFLSEKNGLFGGLLGGTGDMLGGLLDGKSGLLSGKLTPVVELAGGLLKSVARLGQNLAAVLVEVDLQDPEALNDALSPLAVNEVCPACHLLNNTAATRACKLYCTGTCQWQF